MTKKQYLQQGYRLKVKIESEKAVLSELENNIGNIKAISYDSSGSSVTGYVDADGKVINKLDKIIETKENIEKHLIELTSFQSKLYVEILSMEDEIYKCLLRYRYILNLSWSEIAYKLGYTERQTYRLHNKAIKEFKMI